MNTSDEMTLGHVVGAVFTHRKTFVLAAGFVLAVTALFYVVAPRQYGSEGRLYVQAGRTNTGLDPTMNAKPVSIQDTRETEVRSVFEILKSRLILQQSVEKVGVDRVLAGGWAIPVSLPRVPTSKEGKSVHGLAPHEYDQQKKRELATKTLEENLSVTLEKNSSVISIFAKGASPELAKELVDAIMQFTSEKHVELHASAGSRKFFQQEFEIQERKLVTAVDKQREFRDKHGFMSVDSARNNLQVVIDRLDSQSVDVDVDLAQANQRTAELKKRLSEIPELLSASLEGKELLSTEGARAEMFRLEAQKAKLTATYSDVHPQVVQINEQIKALQAKFDGLPLDRTETNAVVNPVFEKIKTEFISAEATKEGLQGRKENLIVKRAESVDQLKELNQLAVDSEQLQRDIDIARRHLDLYIQKQGEVQVLDQLDRESISDVVVVQPAMLIVKPVSPKASIVLPAGFVCSLLFGTVVSLFRGYRLNQKKSEQTLIEQKLELPVLVTLPRVASRRAVIR